MIVCPNCSHTNPEGALNCEACYTVLPATQACPTCGASIQLDATFCGQCGHNLKPIENQAPLPIVEPASAASSLPATILSSSSQATPPAVIALGPEAGPTPITLPEAVTILPTNESSTSAAPTVIGIPEEVASINAAITTPPIVATPIQVPAHQLLHLQTNTLLDIDPDLGIVYLGKPNDKLPPSIDISIFPSAEVVSRVHASVRLEGESYYIEDLGSANGTYINHNSLAKGNRHLLVVGDRISLGKGDLVTFIFQDK